MKHFANYRIVALCCMAALLSASCKKGGSSSETSREKLLAGAKWTLQSIQYQKSDGTWIDAPKPEATLEFRSDKTVTVISNGSSSIRTWVLSSDASQITIARSSGSGDTFRIVQLTSSTLQLTPFPFTNSTFSDERDTYTR